MLNQKFHPLTGEPLLPVYVTKDGQARWPILGAADPPEGDDGNEGEGDGDDGGDDGADDADKPVFSKTDLTKRLSREKKQGEAALARRLGFETVKELEEYQKAQKDREDAQLSEVEKREKAAEERERKAQADAREAAQERRETALERALIRRGVEEDDLEDAVVLLDRDLDDEADTDAITEAADALKTRRPELFGTKDSDDGTEPKRKSKAQIPGGKPRDRNKPPGATPGAKGLERARKRGFIKD